MKLLNWDRNELEIRLEKLEWRARTFSASANAGVRFRNFLFRHGIHVQDRRSSVGVQRSLLDNLGESNVETGEKGQTILRA
jgi:hypothetical protein